MQNNKKWFRLIIWIMLAAMLLSTLLFSVSAILGS